MKLQNSLEKFQILIKDKFQTQLCKFVKRQYWHLCPLLDFFRKMFYSGGNMASTDLLFLIVKKLLYIVSIDLISSFLVGPEYGLQQIKFISSRKKNAKTENKINPYWVSLSLLWMMVFRTWESPWILSLRSLTSVVLSLTSCFRYKGSIASSTVNIWWALKFESNITFIYPNQIFSRNSYFSDFQ